MRSSHQERVKIGPNFEKTSKNTTPPTPYISMIDIDTFIARRLDGLASDTEKNYVYSWNILEPWTRMKTRQRRRSRRKMTDIAPM